MNHRNISSHLATTVSVGEARKYDQVTRINREYHSDNHKIPEETSEYFSWNAKMDFQRSEQRYIKDILTLHRGDRA